MNSLTLTFNETMFNVVRYEQDIWLTSTELAQALGYKQENAVSKIFNRKADEFTQKMTQLVENSQLPNLGMRIFSLRGCHLIAMFARTPVAKEFRKWVLDVLEKEIQRQQVDTRVKINPQQQAELKEIVDRRANGKRKTYAEMWSRHNKHFQIKRYSDLLSIHFQEAVSFLENMELKTSRGIVLEHNQSLRILCTHSKMFQAWWRTHSPALAQLNPQLTYMLNDNMFYMSCAINDLCKKYGIELPAYDYEHMFELKTLPHERYRLLR